jgi:hypothetical protein
MIYKLQEIRIPAMVCRVLVLLAFALSIIAYSGLRDIVQARARADYSHPFCYDAKGLSYSEGAIIGEGANRKQCMSTKLEWVQPPPQP